MAVCQITKHRLIDGMTPASPAKLGGVSATDSTVERAAGSGRMGLAARVGLLVAALFVEKFVLNFFIDTSLADRARGAGAVVRLVQHVGFRFAVPFALSLALFVTVRAGPALAQINAEARTITVRGRWVLPHLLLFAALAASLRAWYGAHGIHLAAVALSLLLAAGVLTSLLAVLAPLTFWRRSARALGILWIYAAAAAAAASAAFTWSQALWGSTAQVTFYLVRLLLLPLIPTLHTDPATRVLAAQHFAIYVAPYCSGLEGMALMLAFSSAWLVCFRKEYIFPRALLIVPAGLLLIFVLNAVRIAVLMLIGNAGHPGIALYGFHSQAGWIAFNCAACALVLVSRRIPWLNRVPARDDGRSAADNPTAAYLLPLLAILAAGMLSRAVSSGFETWYGLRLVAAAVCLVAYRRRLGSLDWRFGWWGIAAGIAAFAVWLAASRFLVTPHGIPSALAAMTPGARDLWIAARAATAVVAAPLAEELAYRGYLLRRLVAEDFEAVGFDSVGWTPLLVTAAAFGVLHGTLWFPGVLAGIIYGWVLIRTGRMGEAVAAHVTANVLLGVCVIAAGQWQLW
jgi:exosortase E/protease (VPEID-CTERM system)